MAKDTQEERTRKNALRAERQKRWRQGAPGSITLHLSPEDAATLDAIAIGLLELGPHQPQDRMIYPELRPSRQAAVRFLCTSWRQAHNVPRELLALREQCAEYWRQEASRRTITADDCPPPGPPPWSRRTANKCIEAVGAETESWGQ